MRFSIYMYDKIMAVPSWLLEARPIFARHRKKRHLAKALKQPTSVSHKSDTYRCVDPSVFHLGNHGDAVHMHVCSCMFVK